MGWTSCGWSITRAGRSRPRHSPPARATRGLQGVRRRRRFLGIELADDDRRRHDRPIVGELGLAGGDRRPLRAGHERPQFRNSTKKMSPCSASRPRRASRAQLQESAVRPPADARFRFARSRERYAAARLAEEEVEDSRCKGFPSAGGSRGPIPCAAGETALEFLRIRAASPSR